MSLRSLVKTVMIAAVCAASSAQAEGGYTFSCSSPRGPSVSLVTARQTEPNFVVVNDGTTLIDADVEVSHSAYQDSDAYTAVAGDKGTVLISAYHDGTVSGTLALYGRTYDLSCSASAF